MFRDLRVDEIECRVAQARKNGVSLLLYKDARCDMNILDETVGANRWQRTHDIVNGNLYCNVGIWFDRRNDGFGEWVWKQDVGTESNTEKEKGQASDSFKRACFNWGIGRELYTAPFIWVKAEDCTTLKEDGGRWKCFDSFEVASISIENKRITALAIKNVKSGKIVFKMGKQEAVPEEPKEFKRVEPVENDRTICSICGKPVTGIVKNGNVIKTAEEVARWSEEEFNGVVHCWNCAKMKLNSREQGV